MKRDKIKAFLFTSAIVFTLIGCGNSAENSYVDPSADNSASVSSTNEASDDAAPTEATESSASALLSSDIVAVSDPNGVKMATIKTDDGVLRVRKEPNYDSENIGYLASCEEVKVLDETEGWLKIEYNEGNEGYIDSAYANIWTSSGETK
ncbi:MAG: SH3 domain-containing protein [Butyrivibrio sp.]|nr:SH3 domain-containing protein [Butyrivibrio sp.]MEE3470797.1 SH3 domain-containing protein [Butyrivibrio hungatei]